MGVRNAQIRKRDPCENIDLSTLFISVWMSTAIALVLAFDKIYEGSILMGTIAVGMALYFHMCSGSSEPVVDSEADRFKRRTRPQQYINIISITINIINIALSIALLTK